MSDTVKWALVDTLRALHAEGIAGMEKIARTLGVELPPVPVRPVLKLKSK